MQPRSVFLSAHGMRIAAKVWGEKSRQRVLAVHGWQDNASSFDHLAPELVRHGFEVTAIDLPGHGLSQFRSAWSSYTAVEYAVNVAHLLHDSGWTHTEHDHGRFALVGHSMGGAIASSVAAAMPEHVSHLVMIESMGVFSRTAHHAAEHLRNSIDADRVLVNKRPRPYRNLAAAIDARMASVRAAPGTQFISREAADALVRRGTMPAAEVARRVHAAGHWHPVPSTLVEGVCEAAAYPTDPEASEEVVFRHDPRIAGPSPTYLTDTHARAYLRAVTAPTLLVLAEHGWPGPSPEYEERPHELPNAVSCTVSGSSHHLHLDPEHAPQVAQAVAAFLKDRPVVGATSTRQGRGDRPHDGTHGHAHAHTHTHSKL